MLLWPAKLPLGKLAWCRPPRILRSAASSFSATCCQAIASCGEAFACRLNAARDCDLIFADREAAEFSEDDVGQSRARRKNER